VIGQAAAADLKDSLLEHLAQHRGYLNAILGSTLAQDLGISERTLRGLVEELAVEGELIGSACSGEAAGYFLITDERDLAVGTSHLRSHAKAMFRRYGAVQRAARVKFGSEVAGRLFSIEELDAANDIARVNGFDHHPKEASA